MKRFILIATAVAGLVAIALIASSYWLFQRPMPGLIQSQLLEIKSGSHTRSVLRDLAAKGVQVEPQRDYLSIRLWSNSSRLQAGVYQLEPGMSLEQLFNKLATGDQHLFTITLIEGQTLAQWRQQLAAHPYLKKDTNGLSNAELYERISADRPWPSLEGALFPDTYSFHANTSEVTILKSAFTKMQDAVERAWSVRWPDLPLKSKYELMIMASIIEKETGFDSERGLVSSVFINRINEGMRLQSDPTTIYGIDNFDGNLTRAHLRESTAYNTYRIDGLPPTPIAMSSYDSLLAAAQPDDSEYFYFVSNGKGEHIFSRTLAEHNRAVNKYQRNTSN